MEIFSDRIAPARIRPLGHSRFDSVALVPILAAAIVALRSKLILAARRPEVGGVAERREGWEMRWMMGG